MRTQLRLNTLAKASLPAAVALTFATLATTSANADVSQVLSHYYDPGTEITSSTIVCDPGGTAIHGSATFGTQTGDIWHGTTSYDYCLYPTTNTNEYTYSGRETFTGSVEGGGTGSFTWIATGSFTEGSSTPGGGTWQIISGSGTGELSEARGSGTDTAYASPTLANYGEFDGTFKC